MPAMCALMTSPTTWSVAPPWFMWTGVIDMSPTMTRWLRTIAPRARRAVGLADTTAHPARRPSRHDDPLPSPGPAPGAAPEAAPGTAPGPASDTASALARDASSGSGRSQTTTTAAASANATVARTNGAALGAVEPCCACASPPRRRLGPATRSASPASVGPTTDPTVVAHTTTDRSRARRWGVARSVAAKRDASPAAVPDPKRSIATTSSGQEPTSTATVARTAPPVATPKPRSRDGRRPRWPATCARGSATSAAPTTPDVDVRPAIASDPESADATSGATAIPLATPTPESTCVAARVVRVRRCVGSAGTSSRTSEVGVDGGVDGSGAGGSVLTGAR